MVLPLLNRVVEGCTAWLVGTTEFPHQPLVAHTSDAGALWTRQSLPPNVDGDLYAVAFLDASLGVVGGAASTSSTPLLLITEDGGASWRPVDLPSNLASVVQAGFAR